MFRRKGRGWRKDGGSLVRENWEADSEGEREREEDAALLGERVRGGY